MLVLFAVLVVYQRRTTDNELMDILNGHTFKLFCYSDVIVIYAGGNDFDATCIITIKYNSSTRMDGTSMRCVRRLLVFSKR